MRAHADQVVFLLSTSWLVAIGGFARGDFSYDFASPPPVSFQTGVIGPPSPTFGTSFADGMLRLADSRTPAQGGIGGTTGFGAFGLEQSQIFGDVRISAVLNPAGNSDDLLNLTRGHGGVGVYAAGIDFSSGRLTMAKLLPGGLGPVAMFNSDDPNQGSQPLLTNLNRSYFLTLDVIGNEVNARVYDQPGGSQLLQGHFTDNNLGGPSLQPSIAGVSVIWLGTNATNLDGSYDNFSAVAIRAIPEPSSAILLSVGLVVVIVRFRRGMR
jgi:hypothetical protein